MSRPQAPGALCAFADPLATLPDPRDRRGVRDPQALLLGTLLVALAGGADNMAAVAAFAHDHQAWFRPWLPLGERVPTDDTYRLWVRRLDPETAMKAALLLLDGTRLPGLEALILALDGKVARRSGDRAAGLRSLHRVSAFLVREGLTPTGSRATSRATRLRPSPVCVTASTCRGPWSRSTPPAVRRPSYRPCGRPTPTTSWPQAQPGHPPPGSQGGLRRCRPGRLHARSGGPL